MNVVVFVVADIGLEISELSLGKAFQATSVAWCSMLHLVKMQARTLD